MVGEKIKKVVTESAISPTLFASKVGMSESNLRKLYKRDSVETKYLEAICQVTGYPMSYFFSENDDVPVKSYQKSLDGGKFGTEVEEELRAQIDQMRKQVEMMNAQLIESNRNNEFLRKMMERLTDSLEKIAGTVGKEMGCEAMRLPFHPEEQAAA